MIFSIGGSETEIDFMLIGKNNKKYLKDMKAILCKLHYQLVITDENVYGEERKSCEESLEVKKSMRARFPG